MKSYLIFYTEICVVQNFAICIAAAGARLTMDNEVNITEQGSTLTIKLQEANTIFDKAYKQHVPLNKFKQMLIYELFRRIQQGTITNVDAL